MFKRGNPLNPMGIEVDNRPSELYPKMALPVPGPLAETEKKSAAQFVSLRQAIRDGPLYTGSNTSDKGRVVVEVEQSINDGIKRYTDRYARKVKIGRSVDEHPYVLKFFPSELHKAMGITKETKKKKLNISKFTDELMKTENNEGGGDENDSKSLFTKRLNEAENDATNENEEGGGGAGDSNDEDAEDDDFDEDEEDGDDYNAEQYFSNGEDDDIDGGSDDNDNVY